MISNFQFEFILGNNRTRTYLMEHQMDLGMKELYQVIVTHSTRIFENIFS